MHKDEEIFEANIRQLIGSAVPIQPEPAYRQQVLNCLLEQTKPQQTGFPLPALLLMMGSIALLVLWMMFQLDNPQPSPYNPFVLLGAGAILASNLLFIPISSFTIIFLRRR